MIVTQPMSNYERQVKFRQNHPGYFNKYNARRQAATRAMRALRNAGMMAPVVTEGAAPAPMATPAPLAIPMPAQRLMLPAPVEAIILPGLKTLQTLRVPAA